MIDYGLTDGAYTATHNLSLYRYQSSGSIVFGAGTVFWAWGLDSDHDLQLTVPPTTMRFPRRRNGILQHAGGPKCSAGHGEPVRGHGCAAADACSTGLVAATKSTDTTAPVSTISPPASRDRATDRDDYRDCHRYRRPCRWSGGFDRRRCHLASGHRHDELDLQLVAAGAGNRQYLVPRDDDSLNLETPGAGHLGDGPARSYA